MAIWISKWPRSVFHHFHEYLHSRWKSDSAGAPSSAPSRGHLPFLEAGFRHQHELYGLRPGDVAVIAKQPAGLGIITSPCRFRRAQRRARELFSFRRNLDRHRCLRGLGDPMKLRRHDELATTPPLPVAPVPGGLLLIAMTARARRSCVCASRTWCITLRPSRRLRCVGRRHSSRERRNLNRHAFPRAGKRKKGVCRLPSWCGQPGGKFQHLIRTWNGARIPHRRGSLPVSLGRRERQFYVLAVAGTFSRAPRRALRQETVTQDSAEMPVFDPEAMPFTKEWVSKHLRLDVFQERIRPRSFAHAALESFLGGRRVSYMSWVTDREVNERDGRKARQKQTMRVTVRNLVPLASPLFTDSGPFSPPTGMPSTRSCPECPPTGQRFGGSGLPRARRPLTAPASPVFSLEHGAWSNQRPF